MSKKKDTTPAPVGDIIGLPAKEALKNDLKDAKDKSFAELQKGIEKHHLAAFGSYANALHDALRAGVQLLEVKSRLAHGFWTQWLAENFSPETGLSKRTAERYMRAVKNYLETPPELLDASLQHSSLENLSLTRLLDRSSNRAGHTPASTASLPPVRGNDWLTPKPIVDAAVSLLGEIDLDPAAEAAASNVPAKTHITASQNALGPDPSWQGSVFLNPGCKRQLLPWVERLLAAFDAHEVSAALLVLPAPGHNSWSSLIRTFPAAFARDQLTVSLPDSDQLAVLKQPLMFVYVAAKPNLELFAKHFCPFSDIYVPFSAKESKQ